MKLHPGPVIRATTIVSALLLLVPCGAAAQAATGPDLDPAKARDVLADLLASQEIGRIDFEAQTYDEAMHNIHAAVDTILELTRSDDWDLATRVDRASQVIEALDGHTPRGLLTTIGKNVDRIPITDPGEARMLGELVGTTVSMIREQTGVRDVSYRDKADNLFRTVVLDVEEGPLLVQYLDAIRRIAEQPPAARARLFQ